QLSDSRDMEAPRSRSLGRCMGCGGLFETIDGPTHRYMESSPGCWRAYGEVLAREFSDPTYLGVHRLTADAYAVQHPGRPSSRQAIQSVAVHLISIHLLLERGASVSYAERGMRAALEVKGQFIWLTPPASMGPITVADVRRATTPSDHARLVREWVEG